MAWQSNISDFKLILKKFGKEEIPRLVVAFQKKIAFELFRRVLMKTPVDKGFLRGAWTLSIDAPSYERTESMQSLSKSKTIKDGSRVPGVPADQSPIAPLESQRYNDQIAMATNLKMGGTIWLTNRMPYVERIEFGGWSRVKAPRGMLGLSINETVQFVKQEAGSSLEVEKK